eukprot:2945379-Ditylum_brightwellii.AAC.1
MKDALESLKGIGEVIVTRYDNSNGHNYFVTFLTELGNIELMSVDYSQLTGPNAKARVATIEDGQLPSNFGRKSIGSSLINEYTIRDLQNGTPYYIRIRARNSEGLGGYTTAMPALLAPKEQPSTPSNVQMFNLDDDSIMITWQAPENDGGSPVNRYLIQWDTDEEFSNASSPNFHKELFLTTKDGPIFCHIINLNGVSSSIARYGRVIAFNDYKWSEAGSIVSATALARPPGPTKNFKVIGTSGVGIMLNWSYPTPSCHK